MRVHIVVLAVLCAHALFADAGKGALCLTFDDRNFQGWESALPTFRKYGAHATFFIYGAVDAGALSMMRKLKGDGHSLGFHGLRHAKADEAVARVGGEKYLADEVLPQVEAARAAGFEVRNWGYPNSRRSQATDLLLGRFFTRMRTGWYRKDVATERLRDQDPIFAPVGEAAARHLVYGAGIPSTFDGWKDDVEGALERAAERNEVVFLYSHNIRRDGRKDPHDISAGQLEAILAKAHGLGLRILGFDELQGFGPEPVPGIGPFDVSPREIFRDNAAMRPQRSGHMGHALIDCGGGRILDFCSNCDGFRAEGHSGYGWMEYCVSTNWGRTFGPPRVLEYSKRLYEEGRHTAICEKGVCLADGRVVLFFQITDQSKPVCCEPWSASTMIVSEDGGETWGEPRPTGAKPGRIYDALVRGDEVMFLLQENEHFLGKGPQHVYKLYRAGPDLAFAGVTLPFDAKGKGYGAMEFAADGALQAYVYDSEAESEMCCAVSRDGGRTWGPVRRCHMDKLIRNPQIRRLDGLWFCTGRNGGGPESDGIVLYASADGLRWNAGEKIDERPKGEGTGYYSCLLPVREPGAAPRMLLQYSHVYKRKRVNIAHRWITPRQDP